MKYYVIQDAGHSVRISLEHLKASDLSNMDYQTLKKLGNDLNKDRGIGTTTLMEAVATEKQKRCLQAKVRTAIKAVVLPGEEKGNQKNLKKLVANYLLFTQKPVYASFVQPDVESMVFEFLQIACKRLISNDYQSVEEILVDLLSNTNLQYDKDMVEAVKAAVEAAKNKEGDIDEIAKEAAVVALETKLLGSPICNMGVEDAEFYSPDEEVENTVEQYMKGNESRFDDNFNISDLSGLDLEEISKEDILKRAATFLEKKCTVASLYDAGFTIDVERLNETQTRELSEHIVDTARFYLPENFVMPLVDFDGILKRMSELRCSKHVSELPRLTIQENAAIIDQAVDDGRRNRVEAVIQEFDFFQGGSSISKKSCEQKILEKGNLDTWFAHRPIKDGEINLAKRVCESYNERVEAGVNPKSSKPLSSVEKFMKFIGYPHYPEINFEEKLYDTVKGDYFELDSYMHRVPIIISETGRDGSEINILSIYKDVYKERFKAGKISPSGCPLSMIQRLFNSFSRKPYSDEDIDKLFVQQLVKITEYCPKPIHTYNRYEKKSTPVDKTLQRVLFENGCKINALNQAGKNSEFEESPHGPSRNTFCGNAGRVSEMMGNARDRASERAGPKDDGRGPPSLKRGKTL